MNVNIVKTDFSTEAMLPALPESGGSIRRLVRRVLRKLGFMDPAPQGLNLFQANMTAYRFETDDGRVCIVPLSNRLVDDPAFDAEAEARQLAIPKLAGLTAKESPSGWAA